MNHPSVPREKISSTPAASASLVPLVVLVMAQLGTSSDSSILSIATGTLTASLGATMNDIQIANLMYVLVAGIFMVAGGMVGMMIGWKKNFRIGALLAIMGELVMAASPSMAVFTWGGRVLVGLGASFLIPSVLGLIPTLYAGKQRVFAFGCVAAATGISTLMPIPVGLLLTAFGFRVVFALIAAFFGLILLLSFTIPQHLNQKTSRGFDARGLVVSSLGLLCLLLGISCAASWGLFIPTPQAPFTLFGISPIIVLIVVGCGLLVALFYVERHVEQVKSVVLIPQVFMCNPPTRAALVAVAVPFIVFGAQSILIVPFLQIAASVSVLETGLLLAAAGVPLVSLSMVIAKFFPQTNPRTVIRLGYTVLIVASCLLALSVVPHGYTPGMPLGMILVGTGIGIVNSQANNAVTRSVDERTAQQAGGIQGTIRDIAMAFGIAFFGAALLFALNFVFTAAVSADTSLDVTSKTVVLEQGVAFSSDEAFADTLEDLALSPASAAQLGELHAQAQSDATRIALFSLAAIMALALLTTRNIATTSMASPAPTPSNTA